MRLVPLTHPGSYLRSRLSHHPIGCLRDSYRWRQKKRTGKRVSGIIIGQWVTEFHLQGICLRKLHWPIAMMPNMCLLSRSRPAGRKTRAESKTTMTPVSKGKLSPICLFQACAVRASKSAWTWRRPRYDSVLLHVRAHGDSPVSSATTHVWWQQGQRRREGTDFATVLCLGALLAWPIDRCSNKDAGRCERETPTPL